MPDASPRWLDRDALASYVSARVDELPRLAKAGKLPAPSHHLGPRSPRWWSADVDAMFRGKVASQADPDAVIRDAVAKIQGRQGRQAEAR